MTNTTATPVRILLDDAISEYISGTGDAPHYRKHLLDLLESAVQAEPQDTDLVRTPRGIAIIAGEPEFKDDDSDTLMDHLQAMSYNHKDVETLFEIPELLEVRAELTARLRTPGTVEVDDETAMALIYGAGSTLTYPELHGTFGAAMVRLCETTLQAIPEERRNELMSKLDAEDDSTPPQDTVTISREDAEFIVAKLWVTDRSLFARSGEIQDRIKAQLTQEEPA